MLILIIGLSGVFSFTNAQNSTSLTLNEKKELILNNVQIGMNTSLEEIKSLLGEPVLHKEYVTGKVDYHYSELGISVQFMKDELMFIGVNYNWDGDETFPETTYEGELMLGETSFDKNSTKATIDGLELNVDCILPGLCMGKEGEMGIIIGYKDELVTQVGFAFK